ncbi:hypothetical protein J5N97_016173 [Dioscorea zingiberensis]|uniref:Uncharacterized protein n=1 Tax=Dioscorea zingiberensis TaxID=325984 RepID=A0A9D5HFD6_9LILI|nr:hypothetical protein J5N97_016173 [Dioscorea zingiberensis]
MSKPTLDIVLQVGKGLSKDDKAQILQLQHWYEAKRKGVFQHSSFLAGGAVLAAGRLVIERGILKTVSRDSGHYRPVKESIHEFRNFLERNNVDLSQLNIGCIEDDMEIPNGKKHLENLEAESKGVGVHSLGECKEKHSIGTILDRNEKKAKRSSQMEDCAKHSKKLKIENNEDN